MLLRAKAARAGALAVGLLTLSSLGCNGASGGPNGNAQSAARSGPSTPAASTAPRVKTGPVRPDTYTGASPPSVSLKDGREHEFVFPSIQGTVWNIALDTTPSNADIGIRIEERATDGSIKIVPLLTPVQTPNKITITASMDATMAIVLSDPAGASTVTTLNVRPDSQPYDPTSFGVMIHVAGDSFRGLGMYNDLASKGDVGAFVADLVAGVNKIYAQGGIQIDRTRSAFEQLTNAQVASVQPGLVVKGITVIETPTTDASSWCALGTDASVPVVGKALDIFLVHSPDSDPHDTLTGLCECGVPTGGVFVGNGGSRTCLIIPLFRQSGAPATFAALVPTLAHEIGHFLSLVHTTEADFSANDPLPDTPFALPSDLASPDEQNVMYPFLSETKHQFTPDQINAMKGYLAIREH